MYDGSAPPHSSSCPVASATAAICDRSATTASRTSISATAGMLPRGERGGSGRPAADQPYGRGDQQRRQDNQPAGLDPLERPEPAGGLIAGPLRVAVRGEALAEGYRLRRAARSHRTRRALWAVLVEEALGGRTGEGELAVLGPPLAHDPRRLWHVQVAGDRRRHVVRAQPRAGREGERGVGGQGGGDRGDNPADEQAGQGADRERDECPGGKSDPAQT